MLQEFNNTGPNDVNAYMKRIPQLKLTTKVLKPFLSLSGFDDELRNVSIGLGEFLKPFYVYNLFISILYYISQCMYVSYRFSRQPLTRLF